MSEPKKPETADKRKEPSERPARSWWCDKCCVEVYQMRCKHCGKSLRELA